MDLLSLITESMTSSTSANTLSEKSGVSSEQAAQLVAAALPILMQSMQSNASTDEGAASLLNALTQHTETAPVAQQIATADDKDGAKILAHILGKKQDETVTQLSKKNGLSSKQVKLILSIIAPVLLSSLSAATSSSNKKKKQGIDLSDGLDMNDVLALVSAASGKKKPASSGLDVGTMLSLLGTIMK